MGQVVLNKTGTVPALRDLPIPWEWGAFVQGAKRSRKGVEGQACVPSQPCFIFLLSTRKTTFPSFLAARWGHVTSCHQWNVGGSEVQHFQAWPTETSPQIFHTPFIGLQSPRARVSKCFCEGQRADILSFVGHPVSMAAM